MTEVVKINYAKCMDLLPIRYITREDATIIGNELRELGALKRLGFPVPEGLVLFPPDIPFKEVLKSFKEHDRDRFEQSLTIIKSKLYALPKPYQLDSELKNKNISADIVWKDVLTNWLGQIRAKVWQQGSVSDDLITNLPPQPIFFTGIQKASGTAFYRNSDRKIIIEVSTGQINEKEQEKIEELILRLKKKVFFNYVIHWILENEGEIFIVKVQPFTNADNYHLPVKEKIEISVKDKDSNQPEVKKIKTSLKIYADLSEGLTMERDLDGIFLASEKIESEDQKILKLVESALACDETVIFQLTDIRSSEDVSSTLRLIHQPELLAKEIRTYQFAKHNYTKQVRTDEGVLKQSLLHIQLGLPLIHSVRELVDIKKELKKLGVERKGNQKLWLDFSVPENWVNINQYINEGIDGLIVNIEQLEINLLGLGSMPDNPYYKFDPKIVTNFIRLYAGQIKKSNLMLLFRGEHALDPEIVKFSLLHGFSGLILKSYQLPGADEYIARLEKHHFLDRNSTL